VLTRLAVVAVAAAALAGAALAGSASTIAKPFPAATLQAETAAFNAKSWAAAYSAYTAKYKALCPYAKFVKGISAERAQFSGPVSVRMKSTRVVGAKAWLVYSLIYRGKAVATVPAAHPDLYTRIGGLWYDDYEGSTVCS
jgi:hypothetical protein